MKNYKKVLMIAYYFPPLGGAGVQRTLNFANYLPDFGWIPTVVTVANNRYYVKDFSLLQKVRKDISIIRVPTFEILNYYHYFKKVKLHKIISLIDKITSVPDSQVFWYLNVIRNIKGKIDIKDYDIIYATFGPGSNLLVGAYLAKKYNKPLVIDFRDEWANSPQVHNRIWLKIKRPIFKRLEEEIVNVSDTIICLNKIMKSNFIRNYPMKNPDKFVVIPNGFTELYQKSRFVNRTLFNDSKLNIVYSGSFYGFQQPDNFLKALRLLLEKHPNFMDKINVYFIGNVKTATLIEALNDNLLKKVINIVHFLPHEKLIDYLLSADLLLLIIGNVKGAEEIYTGKLFEYLAIGKPILGIVPINGVAAEVIKKTNSGFVADTGDIEYIYRTIKYILKKWEENQLFVKQNEGEVLKYSASNLTGKLVKVFEGIVI